MPSPKPWGHSWTVPLNFFAPQILLCPEAFVLNICHNENKNLAPLTVYFVPQIWLQACFMPAYTFKLLAFWQLLYDFWIFWCVPYMHKMIKSDVDNTSVSWIKNMFYNYVYSQQPSQLMEFRCNFHFIPVYIYFQTCGILTVMTSASARFSDFSPYVIFEVEWHRICDLTVAMIDQTSSGYNMCRHKNSLPSPLTLHNLCENLLEC